MAMSLVEVLHENCQQARDRAVRIFTETGFHFMTNAHWGRSDDVHVAWFFVVVDGRKNASALLSSLLRQGEYHRCGEIPIRGCGRE